MGIIHAIIWEILTVLIMAHPIILLSREKLFKENSIDKATAFFE